MLCCTWEVSVVLVASRGPVASAEKSLRLCQLLHAACRVCAAAQHALWSVQQPLQGP